MSNTTTILQFGDTEPSNIPQNSGTYPPSRNPFRQNTPPQNQFSDDIDLVSPDAMDTDDFEPFLNGPTQDNNQVQSMSDENQLPVRVDQSPITTNSVLTEIEELGRDQVLQKITYMLYSPDVSDEDREAFVRRSDRLRSPANKSAPDQIRDIKEKKITVKTNGNAQSSKEAKMMDFYRRLRANVKMNHDSYLFPCESSMEILNVIQGIFEMKPLTNAEQVKQYQQFYHENSDLIHASATKMKQMIETKALQSFNMRIGLGKHLSLAKSYLECYEPATSWEKYVKDYYGFSPTTAHYHMTLYDLSVVLCCTLSRCLLTHIWWKMLSGLNLMSLSLILRLISGAKA